METFRKIDFDRHVGKIDFVQDNESESVRGVLRGLHLQSGHTAQSKLVRVVEGKVYDVAVDMRPDSATFGQWFGIELSHRNGLMLFIPRGFAHGFVVLSRKARFVYKVDRYYAPGNEVTIAYNDPDITVDWPNPGCQLILSERDLKRAISFAEYRRTTDNKER